jgi:hypothetical protein
MTHDTALLVGYGLTAAAIVVELIGLRLRRRRAEARVGQIDDDGNGEPT